MHKRRTTTSNERRLRWRTESYGDRIRAIALDVTDPVAARAAVQTALDEFGGLDVVANNAGYANSAAIEQTTDADFRQIASVRPLSIWAP